MITREQYGDFIEGYITSWVMELEIAREAFYHFYSQDANRLVFGVYNRVFKKQPRELIWFLVEKQEIAIRVHQVSITSKDFRKAVQTSDRAVKMLGGKIFYYKVENLEEIGDHLADFEEYLKGIILELR